ncbi:MAG: hypothetical protein Q9222_000290 [Ikaeria aurantiellina]
MPIQAMNEQEATGLAKIYERFRLNEEPATEATMEGNLSAAIEGGEHPSPIPNSTAKTMPNVESDGAFPVESDTDDDTIDDESIDSDLSEVSTIAASTTLNRSRDALTVSSDEKSDNEVESAGTQPRQNCRRLIDSVPSNDSSDEKELALEAKPSTKKPRRAPNLSQKSDGKKANFKAVDREEEIIELDHQQEMADILQEKRPSEADAIQRKG